jgi:hypothetical protein
MSWRLDEKPEVHGPGLLPGCFTVYNSAEDLKAKLLDFKECFNVEKTPRKVFDIFVNTYPNFYYGNSGELERFIKLIELEA